MADHETEINQQTMKTMRPFNRLPEELIERIIANLPISSVFRCRCVCKQWNQLLTSSFFFNLWDPQFSSRDLWFVIYHTSYAISAYSIRCKRWIDLPLFDRCSLDLSNPILSASSGGLLLFRNLIPGSPSLIVCNPISNSHRILPDMIQIRHIDIVRMIPGRFWYKILVTGNAAELPGTITEVYDSQTGLWEHHCVSEQKFLPLVYDVATIWHNGFLYCLESSWDVEQEYPLVAYDMLKRAWVDLNVRVPSRGLECPSLLIFQGKLVMVGRVEEDRSICVWELNMEQLRWEKFDEMPDDLSRTMRYSHFQCQAHGDLMCFKTNQRCQSIIYNLTERSWDWLPKNDLCDQSESQAPETIYFAGLLYEPSLSARV